MFTPLRVLSTPLGADERRRRLVVSLQMQLHLRLSLWFIGVGAGVEADPMGGKEGVRTYIHTQYKQGAQACRPNPWCEARERRRRARGRRAHRAERRSSVGGEWGRGLARLHVGGRERAS